MRIAQIDPFADMAAVEEIIKVYQAAFGGEPWNEGWKCRVCEHVVPLHPAPSICPKCHKLTMEQYWPYNKVLSDFQGEMRRPGAICLVATIKRQIVGFAWGYNLSFASTGDGEEWVEKHLDAPGLCDELWKRSASCGYFYLDDVAVHPDYQQDGIGKELVKRIVHGHRQVLLRTLGKSQMFNLVKGIGGDVVLAITRERVIMRIFPPPEIQPHVDRGGGAVSTPHRGDNSPMSDPGFGRLRGGDI